MSPAPGIDRRRPRAEARAGAIASLVLLVAAPGCWGSKEKAAPPVSMVPDVHVAKLVERPLVRAVGQPGVITSYEETKVYAKLAGYVLKWNVDIGDRIEKGQLLAELYIPELAAELKAKQAQVALDRVTVEQTEQAVKVAKGDLDASAAAVQSAQAAVVRAQSEAARWESEVQRLEKMVTARVVDREVLGESHNQLRSSQATLSGAKADVQTAEARRIAASASLAKSGVDVSVARARVLVSQADEERLGALLGYTKLMAPYDGIVTVRNVNTGDFVLPLNENTSSGGRDPVNGGGPAPLYVVARTDVVRIYVDVPEVDANYVAKGSKATVRVQALDDLDLPAAVTRTSWALNARSRTLRAEIDLPNTDTRLLPGMYAYGSVMIDRPHARVLPRSAILEDGDQFVCFLCAGGKAIKTPVRFGVTDGGWVEMLKKRVGNAWVDFDGSEQFAVGDLSDLSDGQDVNVLPEKVAARPRGAGPSSGEGSAFHGESGGVQPGTNPGGHAGDEGP